MMDYAAILRGRASQTSSYNFRQDLLEAAHHIAKIEGTNRQLVGALKLIECVDQGAGGNLHPMEMANSAMRQARSALLEYEQRLKKAAMYDIVPTSFENGRAEWAVKNLRTGKLEVAGCRTVIEAQEKLDKILKPTDG